MRRQRGFTLVELLVVIALIAMVAAVAAASMRSTRGENIASFTRAMMAQVNVVRHTAIAQQQPTRLVIQASGVTYTVSSQVWNPTTKTFQDLGTVLTAPTGVLLCNVDDGPVLTLSTPTCPLTATYNICFSSSGASFKQTASSCATPAVPAGETLYATTIKGDKKYKMPIFGLTGMVKFMDAW